MAKKVSKKTYTVSKPFTYKGKLYTKSTKIRLSDEQKKTLYKYLI